MIRYYKGKYMVIRISKTSPMKTALYLILEAFNQHNVWDMMIAPVRLCWRKRK